MRDNFLRQESPEKLLRCIIIHIIAITAIDRIMKRHILLFGFVLLVSLSCEKNSSDVTKQDVEYGFLSAGAPEALTKAEQENVAKVNTFALSMASQLNKSEKAGFVFSPISLAYLLGMVSDGAAGETRAEICKVLGFGFDNQQEINEFCRDLIVLTSRSESETLKLANTCVADCRFPVKEEYRKELHNYYDAMVRNFDFSQDDVAGYINQWASEHTNGKISKVTDRVSGWLCLANAMYFQGEWSCSFDPFLTGNQPFYKEDGSREDVKMMKMLNRSKIIKYYKGDDFQVATLGYGQKMIADYSMSIFLPDTGTSLSELLSGFDGDKVSSTLSSAKGACVELIIPKFNVGMERSIVDDAKALGINSIFDDSANFSRMTTESVCVTEMKHFARVTVDESGTEASAVSYAEFDPTAPPPDDGQGLIHFTADHPFLFVITENTTGAILFMGCYRG